MNNKKVLLCAFQFLSYHKVAVTVNSEDKLSSSLSGFMETSSFQYSLEELRREGFLMASGDGGHFLTNKGKYFDVGTGLSRKIKKSVAKVFYKEIALNTKSHLEEIHLLILNDMTSSIIICYAINLLIKNNVKVKRSDLSDLKTPLVRFEVGFSSSFSQIILLLFLFGFLREADYLFLTKAGVELIQLTYNLLSDKKINELEEVIRDSFSERIKIETERQFDYEVAKLKVKKRRIIESLPR